MSVKATMPLTWVRVPGDVRDWLMFGGVRVGCVAPWDESGYDGDVRSALGSVLVCDGRSRNMAKSIVKAHVLREMEREVARAKKARKR